jgi:hypothetical protein
VALRTQTLPIYADCVFLCVKLTNGKKGKKTELTGKGPLRRRRSALDCSATEEEEEEEMSV